MMKRLLLIASIVLSLSILLSIPLRVFYTNDTHGTYLPRTYTINGERIKLGGYMELEHVLNAQRAEVTRSIYLDAGDQQTGSAFASLDYNGAIGGAVIEVFNRLKLDAACLGNHEFDISIDNTRKLMQLAKYPFLTTNIFSKSDTTNFSLPYTVIEADSLRIGIMGLTLTELPEKVKAANVKDINVLPYKAAIDLYLDELDSRSDFIILLTHNGFEADSLLATLLDERIQLIIGGHSHTTITDPVIVNGIIILQSGSYLNYLGQIDLEIENRRIVSYHNKLLPVQVPSRPASTDLSRMVDRLRAEIDHNLNRVIGIIPTDWIPDKFSETAVSQWQIEALMLEYKDLYHPDVAMINCGGIRKAVAKGEITLKDMNEMLPFGNTVTTFTCLGKDLESFFIRNATINPYDSNGIVHSTLVHRTDSEDNTDTGFPQAYIDIIVNGDTLDPERTYRVITHDYLAGQWQKYLGFEPQEVYDTGDLLLDVMVRQVIHQYGK